jgi:pre-mRNA-splicing factor 38B
VTHLEPWEKGSRRTQGLTGMCGGVRGVGSGGIVSTAYCLLYKLHTLKLTRKQLIGLITHTDSPYIRALGFMYIRYTQNPQDLWDWYYDYLDDEEEIDVKAGGGVVMTIGQMLRQWLIKLEWYDTLFPRIPVPIQKEIMDGLRERYGNSLENAVDSKRTPPIQQADSRRSRSQSRSRSRTRSRSRSAPRYRSRTRSRSRTRDRARSKSRSKTRNTSRTRRRHHTSSRSKSRSRSSSSSKRRHRHNRHHRHHKRHKHDRDRSKERDRSSTHK